MSAWMPESPWCACLLAGWLAWLLGCLVVWDSFFAPGDSVRWLHRRQSRRHIRRACHTRRGGAGACTWWCGPPRSHGCVWVGAEGAACSGDVPVHAASATARCHHLLQHRRVRDTCATVRRARSVFCCSVATPQLGRQVPPGGCVWLCVFVNVRVCMTCARWQGLLAAQRDAARPLCGLFGAACLRRPRHTAGVWPARALPAL
jgi:hypothetical protein